MKTLAINLDEIVIRPITNLADFEDAGKVIDMLVDADLLEDPSEKQKALDILEAITVLAIDYEKRHFPIPKPDPIEAIKFRMEQMGYNQTDLANIIGLKSRASEILSRKRKLSLEMIRQLHESLHIPTDVLIQIY